MYVLRRASRCGVRTVHGVSTVSLWWCLRRGGLPSVDASVRLLAASYDARLSRRWVRVLLALPLSLRFRVASMLALRVREGVDDSSWLVRGWAASVLVYASCHGIEPVEYRLGMPAPVVPSALLELGWLQTSSRDLAQFSVLERVVWALEAWSFPLLDRLQVLRVVAAVRAVWSSPALEHVLELAAVGVDLQGRARAGEFLSSAWLLSAAFADPVLQDPAAFTVDTEVLSPLGGLFLTADGSCLCGVSPSEVVASSQGAADSASSAASASPSASLSDSHIAERAALAMALSDGWYDWVDPKWRAIGPKLSPGHRPALSELLAAVWALSSTDLEDAAEDAVDDTASSDV